MATAVEQRQRDTTSGRSIEQRAPSSDGQQHLTYALQPSREARRPSGDDSAANWAMLDLMQSARIQSRSAAGSLGLSGVTRVVLSDLAHEFQFCFSWTGLPAPPKRSSNVGGASAALPLVGLVAPLLTGLLIGHAMAILIITMVMQ